MNFSQYQNRKQLQLNLQEYLLMNMHLLKDANVNPLKFDCIRCIDDSFFDDEHNFQALSSVEILWDDAHSVILDAGARDWGEKADWLENIDETELCEKIYTKDLIYKNCS